jgi:hypothetical protein
LKGKPIRGTADFSTELLKARRIWNSIFQVLKEDNFQPRLLYLENISFIIEGEIRTFHYKQKLKQFMNTTPALQKILKRVVSVFQ